MVFLLCKRAYQSLHKIPRYTVCSEQIFKPGTVCQQASIKVFLTLLCVRNLQWELLHSRCCTVCSQIAFNGCTCTQQCCYSLPLKTVLSTEKTNELADAAPPLPPEVQTDVYQGRQVQRLKMDTFIIQSMIMGILLHKMYYDRNYVFVGNLYYLQGFVQFSHKT